ncbi:helix-turn-helix transcriptional regulator [Listeria monocytogenes]|uniref:Helix-turn-helix transcriptional regulator n=2 Tax=Listeria monocytogenes TaxID=1639 RepID=A0AB74NG89_LISMN|nr:helix-turn-helix transcriptional regulator [Listeria monocytogenes]TYU56874.1 helix-turn-helix transcriptional regulator [Listeria monocytogenes]
MEKTGTTQKALAKAVGTRPQSISYYTIGKTQPSPYILVGIARYFDVSVDYLLTGLSSNNVDIHNELGLSEKAIEKLKSANGVDAVDGLPQIIDTLNDLLSDSDFYNFLDDLNFKTSVIKSYKDHPEKNQTLLGNFDIEGYYIWDLQIYVQGFVKNMLVKNGMEIENN